MNESVYFCLNKATEVEVFFHLAGCDADFIPALSARVDIINYAHKIVGKAERFEAWAGGALVGLVAVYCDDIERSEAYITSVSVLRKWGGNGIATGLLEQCIGHVTALGLDRIVLEVDVENTKAIKLYGKIKFVTKEVGGRVAILHLNTKRTS